MCASCWSAAGMRRGRQLQDGAGNLGRSRARKEADMRGNGAERGRMRLGPLSVGLGVLMAMACAPPPSGAQTASAPAVVQVTPARYIEEAGKLQPDEAPEPERLAPLLRSYFPRLQEGLEKLPPFIRDTDLNLRFRTFYFDRTNPNETENEAWAIGGWLEYRSGWLYDTFAIGAVGY